MALMSAMRTTTQCRWWNARPGPRLMWLMEGNLGTQLARCGRHTMPQRGRVAPGLCMKMLAPGVVGSPLSVMRLQSGLGEHADIFLRPPPQQPLAAAAALPRRSSFRCSAAQAALAHAYAYCCIHRRACCFFPSARCYCSLRRHLSRRRPCQPRRAELPPPPPPQVAGRATPTRAVSRRPRCLAAGGASARASAGVRASTWPGLREEGVRGGRLVLLHVAARRLVAARELTHPAPARPVRAALWPVPSSHALVRQARGARVCARMRARPPSLPPRVRWWWC